jgi:hypothetical protein
METVTADVGASAAPVHIPRESTAIARRDPYAQLAQFASHLENLQLISERLCKSTLLPKSMNNPANLQLVLAQGLEMGFTVMQAIRASFVIESKNAPPKIGYYVEGLVALVRQSGVCRFFRVEIGTADKCRVVCARKDEDENVLHVFEMTMAEAKAANLDKKWERDDNGKVVALQKYTWITAPADMLRNRTSGRAVKSVFQDVIFGMATPDELDDIKDADVIEMMESGPGRFEPVPVNANVPAATHVELGRKVTDPDVPPAEYPLDTSGPSIKMSTSGDPGWDAALIALSKLDDMQGTAFDGWLPEDINGHWDTRLSKCETRQSVNGLSPWISVFSKYAEKSKSCGAVAQRMKVTFNDRMSELKKTERIAAGGAS